MPGLEDLCWAIQLRHRVRQLLDVVDTQPELWASIRELTRAADDAFVRLGHADAIVYMEWARR